MKCEICEKEIDPKRNSVVCSDNCKEIRLRRLQIMDKYAHPNGCDNCWGDFHSGCTSQCKSEFQKYGELGQDLMELIRLVQQKLL